MLPIRPVRGTKRYEEHMDFLRYTRKKQSRRHDKENAARTSLEDLSFPYAKEAELDAAHEFARAIASVLGAAADVKLQLEAFNGLRQQSVLAKRAVLSSDQGSATFHPDPGAPTGTVLLEIRQLAAAQLNQSALFAPDSPATVEPGVHRIRILCGGRYTDIEQFVLAGDKHQAVLERLRNGINEAQLGINAKLETDSAIGRIRLSIQGTHSGRAHGFSLQDLTGGLASAAGLLVKDRSATDALFRVNRGEWSSSAGNRVRLDGLGLEAELKRMTEEPVTLRIVPDLYHAVRKLRELIQSVRRWEDELLQASDYINPVYMRSLAAVTSATSLDSLPEILENRFEQTSSGLTGPNGLIVGLHRLVSWMESVPAEELLNRSNTRYKRYANYLQSLDWYSQLPSHGLLLNRFF